MLIGQTDGRFEFQGSLVTKTDSKISLLIYLLIYVDDND